MPSMRPESWLSIKRKSRTLSIVSGPNDDPPIHDAPWEDFLAQAADSHFAGSEEDGETAAEE